VRLAQDKNPQRRVQASITTVRKKGKHLSQSQANNQNPLSARESWSLDADGYAETTMLVFEQFDDEAIAASKLKPNSTVLDVACGPGTLALQLAHHAEQVRGINFSEAMCAIFSKKIEQAGHRNIPKYFCDALPLPTLTSDAWLGVGGLPPRMPIIVCLAVY